MTKEKIEELKEEIRRLKEQYENFVLTMIDQEGLAYIYVYFSLQLFDDKEFMLKVAKQEKHESIEHMLYYTSPKLKNDKEFIEKLKTIKKG